MSAAEHSHHGDHHGHDHGDGHSPGESHGTLGGYLIGFGLSVVLTAVPFWLVMDHVLPNPLYTAVIIIVLAAGP